MPSAAAYNALIAAWLSRRLRSVLAIGGGPWRHPWFTTVGWNDTEKRFEARVNPGFCWNGRAVEVLVETRLETSNGQLETVSKFLTDGPAIPLTQFRSIGGSANIAVAGGSDPGAVPPFFAALGVRSAQTLTTDDLDLGITEVVAGLPDDLQSQPERLLRACDLVLSHERPRTVVDWSFGSGITGSFAQFKVGSSGGLAAHARLSVLARFTEADPVEDITRLAGNYEDTGLDQVKVATVYLLSPPGAAFDAEIDAAWTPYVRHDLFWNAEYRVTAPTLAAQAQNLEVDLAGLANVSGAQFNINEMLAANNDAFAASLEFLTARATTGRFTTPGHRVPPDWDQTTRLDPPFPFKGIPL